MIIGQNLEKLSQTRLASHFFQNNQPEISVNFLVKYYFTVPQNVFYPSKQLSSQIKASNLTLISKEILLIYPKNKILSNFPLFSTILDQNPFEIEPNQVREEQKQPNLDLEQQFSRLADSIFSTFERKNPSEELCLACESIFSQEYKAISVCRDCLKRASLTELRNNYIKYLKYRSELMNPVRMSKLKEIALRPKYLRIEGKILDFDVLLSQLEIDFDLEIRGIKTKTCINCGEWREENETGIYLNCNCLLCCLDCQVSFFDERVKRDELEVFCICGVEIDFKCFRYFLLYFLDNDEGDLAYKIAKWLENVFLSVCCCCKGELTEEKVDVSIKDVVFESIKLWEIKHYFCLKCKDKAPKKYIFKQKRRFCLQTVSN